jgi:hypothetical protein
VCGQIKELRALNLNLQDDVEALTYLADVDTADLTVKELRVQVSACRHQRDQLSLHNQLLQAQVSLRPVRAGDA